MQYTHVNIFSKYFRILNIFIFIISVTLSPTAADDDKHYSILPIRKLNIDHFEEWCKSFDTVVADVDVILHNSSFVNQTHVNKLKSLEAAGKKIFLYSTTMDSTDDLVAKLKTLGYTSDVQIYTPPSALKWHFEKKGIDSKVYVIGDAVFQHSLEKLGITAIHDSDDVSYDDYIAARTDKLDDAVKAVIVGFDLNIKIFQIARALRYLKELKVDFLMTHPKPIFGNDYHRILTRKLIQDAELTTSPYIDRLNGIFGDFLVEKNGLTEKKNVLWITSAAEGNQAFTTKKHFLHLMVGRYKAKKETDAAVVYYYVEHFEKMPHCYDD